MKAVMEELWNKSHIKHTEKKPQRIERINSSATARDFNTSLSITEELAEDQKENRNLHLDITDIYRTLATAESVFLKYT